MPRAGGCQNAGQLLQDAIMLGDTMSAVKDAARGRWPEILSALGGIPREILDGKHHPCPRPGCGGKDRFRMIDEQAGAVVCSQCFANGNGDGIAALQWATGDTFPNVVKRLADYLGLHNGNGQHIDPLELLARKKRCPVESLRKYGAKVSGPRVEFPVYDVEGKQCSTFTIDPRKDGTAGKGLLAKGKPAGLFLTHVDGNVRRPQSGETWHVVEGVKDPAALDGLGLLAVGLPTCKMAAKFAPMFTGVHVVLIPDRDQAGANGAETTAARLHKVAASVRMAALPVEFKLSGGLDVRDVLALPDGETLLRKAIETALPWQPMKPTSDENDIEPICTNKGRTEAMNARRFAVRSGANVRYCQPWGKWLRWDNTRWKQDDCRHVDTLAKEVGKALWAESEAWARQSDPDGDKGNKAVLKLMAVFCTASNSDHGLRAMLALARSEAGIPVLPENLDGDSWLFNVQNGTIDLHTGQLQEHRREDYVTKLAPVTFDPSADCPVWCKFLSVALPDVELRGFVRRLVGYCLTGSTQEHVLPLLYGIGANGKSTFLNAVLALLGTDYAIKAPTDLLLAKKNESHPTELADLFGKRFVACIEAEDGRRLAESLVKELTGGDRIRARRMREDFWEFQATHKIWLAANHKPQVRGTDHGIWRRIKLIPFTVTIPDDEQDKELLNKLLAELPGILNWALAGCEEWQRHGLGEPPTVKVATADYRSEMDVLGDFIADRCIVADGCRANTTALYEMYKAWADEHGERQITSQRFGNQLTERGFEKDRDTASGRIFRHGIGIRESRTP
jgi:putative DNA primase/helicase